MDGRKTLTAKRVIKTQSFNRTYQFVTRFAVIERQFDSARDVARALIEYRRAGVDVFDVRVVE